MPHSNVLSGLLQNLSQATQIVASHPLETLPEVNLEDNEEETEYLKKKKIIQSVMFAEEEKKERPKYTEATHTLRKVSHTPVHKLKNVMFKKMLLKLILYFYDERSKERNCQDTFCDFVFNVLLKKYMMKKAAESRYHHLLASCVKYKTIMRVRLFGRFLGLYDEFNTDDLNFYMDCLQFLQNSPSGIFTISPESIETISVPYVRCIECIKYFEKHLPKLEIPILKAKLDKMRKDDKINKQGVVDIDEFLEQLVETHNDHSKSTKNFMDCIYGAADLNDDGYLQYKEFELLMRYLSEIPFTESLVKRLFDEYAENFTSEEEDEVKAISFENLCQMNLNHKIFVAEGIKRITKVNNGQEALEKLEEVEDRAEYVISELYWRFSETLVWEDHIDELNSLMEIIREKIMVKKNPEKAYLGYCLIDLESKRVLIMERMKELLPGFALGLNLID